MPNNMQTIEHSSSSTAPATGPEKTRAKKHQAWEQVDRESGGLYATQLLDLKMQFPMLTPSELRVCTLVRAMLPTREIARRLHIDERTVENHRIRVRRKLGLRKQNLVQYLIAA